MGVLFQGLCIYIGKDPLMSLDPPFFFFQQKSVLVMVGKIGLATANLFEWTLTFRIPRPLMEYKPESSQALQHEYEVASISMAEESKSGLTCMWRYHGSQVLLAFYLGINTKPTLVCSTGALRVIQDLNLLNPSLLIPTLFL